MNTSFWLTMLFFVAEIGAAVGVIASGFAMRWYPPLVGFWAAMCVSGLVHG